MTRPGLGGCVRRGGQARGEGPAGSPCVCVHTTAHARREDADLTHVSRTQDEGAICERADGEGEGFLRRRAGDGERGVLVEFGDVGESQVEDFRADGVPVFAQRRVLVEEVDDGETGLLSVGDGSVDAREVAGDVRASCLISSPARR